MTLVTDSEEKLALVLAFHGHIGPYVVAGLRAGELAVRELGARKHFGLEAVVRCPDEPPPSCFIDGVQLGSGCTMGKRNLRHEVADEVTATFRNRDTGESISLALSPELMARAVERLRAESDVAGGRVVLEAPEAELFSVTR